MLTLQDLINPINLAQAQAADSKFYRATLQASDEVPASQSKPTNLVISPKGVFICMSITGRFTTLTGAATDSGVCPLSMTWQNGSQRVYIDQPVYMDCLFTPGRVRVAGVTGDPSSQLQFPGLPWVTVFQPKDTLIFKVTNDAAYANRWQIALHGIWVLK